MLESNQRGWIQSPAPKPLGQSSIVRSEGHLKMAIFAFASSKNHRISYSSTAHPLGLEPNIRLSCVWCPQSDSNRHAFRPQGLSLLRLPFHHKGVMYLFGAPPEIRTQTLRGLKPLASAVGLEGHCNRCDRVESNHSSVPR